MLIPGDTRTSCSCAPHPCPLSNNPQPHRISTLLPAPQGPCDPSRPTNSSFLPTPTKSPDHSSPTRSLCPLQPKLPLSPPAPQSPHVPSSPTNTPHPLPLASTGRREGNQRENSSFPSESCWMTHGRIFAANNFCSSIAKPGPPNQYSIAKPGPSNQYPKELEGLVRPGLLWLLSRLTGLMCHFGDSNQGMCMNSVRLSTNEHLQAGKGISEQRDRQVDLYKSPQGH